MNLNQGKFKTELLSMIADFKAHSGSNRSQLMEFYIQTRLNESIKSYYSDLMTSYNYALLYSKNQDKLKELSD